MRRSSTSFLLLTLLLAVVIANALVQQTLQAPTPSIANAWLDPPLYPEVEPRHRLSEDLVIRAEGLQRSNRPEVALPLFRAALEHLDDDGISAIRARALDGLGIISRNFGDLYLGLRQHRQARDMFRRLALPRAEAQALENMGTAYTSLGQTDLARDHLEMAFDGHVALWRRAVVLMELATQDDLEGDCLLAEEKLRRAFGLLSPSAGASRRERLLTKSVLLDRLAGATSSCQQLDIAEQAYRSSLEILDTWGYPRDRAIARANLGVLRLKQQQPEMAQREILAGLKILPPGSFDRERAILYFRLAQAQRQAHQLVDATESLGHALRLLEGVQRATSTTVLRSSFADRHHVVREEWIALMLQRMAAEEDPTFGEEAFLVAEQGRVRDLLYRIENPLAPTHDAATLEGRERQRIESRIRGLEHHRLRVIAGREEAQDITARVASLEEQQRQLVFQLQALTEASDAPSPDPLPLQATPGLESLRALLDSETDVLAYAVGSHTSALWHIDRHSVDSHPLTDPQTLGELTDRVVQWFATSDQQPPAETLRENLEAVGELSRLLLAPVAPKLDGQRLVIIADGPLQRLPFAALDHPDGTGPLVSDHEVVRLPSLSALAALRRRQESQARRPFPSVAVVADPIYSVDGKRSSIPGPPSLAHSAAEAASIRGLLPSPEQGHFFLGAEARRDLLLEQGLPPTSVIHLSVHGELDTQRPELSHLIFSLWDEDQQPLDGKLYVHEISGLDLRCDLLVLSACNTARGKIFRGEGLVGMPYATLGAGAQRALVSLWFVDDEATAALMSAFYEALLHDRLSPVAALQQAQWHLLHHENEDWREPYYWAGFVLYGDWRWPHR